MADVFLSYKREDAARVRKLVAALRESGLEVWWDEDIPPSAPWEATIERALAEAKAIVVCWSPRSVASENVRSEARVAREDGRLIQVFLKRCEPPLFFGERQGVDLSSWRGKADDPRIIRLTESVRKVAAGERVEGGERPPLRKRFDLRIAAAAAAILILIAGVTGWRWLSAVNASGPTTLAVLPFRAVNPADANLVDAIWDDTRGAVSRNPNLRVLGRQAMEALAKKDLTPADYRRKTHADYLLDGSIQHVGDQVQMKLSLTRTMDGAEIWADTIGGKLDDVFAFQQRIAREVEGRIRGRVAPGGGVTSRNIATSGEVYSLFADARAKMRQRNPQSVHEAVPILKKALALDPNYAPAWAELGVATGLGVGRAPGVTVDRQEAQAVSYLKRALQLAPNLAHARAALAMVQNLPPELEGELRKAVALDPNDAEAWNWLANFYQIQNRLGEALIARRRAANIEPLWAINTLSTLVLLKDEKGITEELKRIAGMGDPVLLLKAKWIIARSAHEPGDAIRTALQLRSAYPEEAAWVDARISDPLIQLGYLNEAMHAAHQPSDAASIYRGIPDSVTALKARYSRPIDFWLDDDSPALYGRILPRHGRLSEYRGYYKAAFRSSDELTTLLSHRPVLFTQIAPTVAAVLREAGKRQDADALIQREEAVVAQWLRNGPATPDLLASLAQYRALDAKDDEAVTLLNRAVAAGWLPDRSFYAIDIADEPCFERLVSRADFQRIRRRILARIEEERHKVPLALLAQAYPPREKAA
jgi:TolB-like protein